MKDEEDQEIICKAGHCYTLDPVRKRHILSKGTLRDEIEEDLLRSELPL